MRPLALNAACLALLLAGELVCVALQSIHLVFSFAWRWQRGRALALCHELLVAAHLLVAADLTCCCAFLDAPCLSGVMLSAAWSWRLWANAPLCLVALASARGPLAPLALPEAFLAALCTPWALGALGPCWDAVALADVAFFLARGLAGIVGDIRHRHSELTRLSVLDAVGTVPVGILVMDGLGRALLLNDAMRGLLADLGLPGDLGDLAGTWDGLSLAARDPSLARGLDAGEGERLVLDAPDGRVLLVKRVFDLGPRADVGVFFLDVTDLDAATRELECANDELARTAELLEQKVADVEKIARQAAYLRMRARVHDVVGQRLSIMQRYLEAGRTDDASVAELSVLLSSVARDLHGPAEGGPQAELDAVVAAFSLVDVEVGVDGALPHDARAAGVLVRVVREAATNACRHAQARRVRVVLGTRPGDGGAGAAVATLRVTNDGRAPEGPVREGGGIPGMRRAVEGAGGRLAVRLWPEFSIEAELPLGRGGGHD